MSRTEAARRDSARGAPLPDTLAFMQTLWAVVHGVQSASKRMSADAGVTGPQRLVLRVLGLRPGTSAGDLAATLHVHPSTLTGVLRRVVDQQLVRRVADPADARRVLLRLTPQGRKANARRRGTVEAAVALALAAAAPADRAAARRVLERLAHALVPADAGRSRPQASPSRRRGGGSG